MIENTLLMAFYGDDFTGSTDAMEALAINHYRTVLFLEAPSIELLRQFEGLSCFGVAGTSRAKNPEAMEQELRPVFEQLAKTPVPLVHYKTCSTFDSSPEIGNIGKAIEVSRDYFTGHAVIPLLVGAPALGRFTIFGQHFARMRDTIYRLDRHPTMAKHPVTPMNEADLRLHLAKQTPERIGLMNILELDGNFDGVRERFAMKLAERPGLLLFDVLDHERLAKAARLVWEKIGEQTQFMVGSSGWEYAMAAYWKSAGLQPAAPALQPELVHKAKQILVVSGSCSPVTQSQIQWALGLGFHGIKVPIDDTVDFDKLPAPLIEQVIRQLGEGDNVLLYTASGPDDDAINVARNRLATLGVQDFQTGEVIGRYLGALTREVLLASGIRRVVVAGGDTSGFVTRELGVYGLEMISPVSPGAPLCKAYGREHSMDGLELALKGGQMGGEDYFHQVLTAGV
jgi:uncharacterized protein YgbK (DUF1537 family)